MSWWAQPQQIEGEALAKADGEGWSVAFGDRRRGM